jgi:hypothetical protein
MQRNAENPFVKLFCFILCDPLPLCGSASKRPFQTVSELTQRREDAEKRGESVCETLLFYSLRSSATLRLCVKKTFSNGL